MAKTHRMYRNSWKRAPKELTERDYQAMCNFAASPNYISFESMAQHFGCSVAHINEEIVYTNDYYGYIRKSKPGKASDWGAGPDALETFQRVMRAPRHEMTYQEYLDTIDWMEAYEHYGDKALEVVKEKASEIAARSNLELVFAD